MPDQRPRAPAARALLAWGLFTLIIIGLDQWTKHLVSTHLGEGQSLPQTGFFSLVLVYNSGAAFSFLAGAGGWQRPLFMLVAAVASLLIIGLMVRHRGETLLCAALAMILGGALGNLYDRVTLGRVVDFLLFHYGPHAFPAFNLADSSITGGVGLLLLDGLRARRRPDAARPGPQA
jgi:signal peptidase II